jgi:2-oxoisovalerate dehydrogenase E2 component (dihydrolipoyl transacylase)
MGEHIIKLPDVGEGVAEAELVEWHVKIGDIVREDTVLAAVMTDKATVEIPSPVDGEILWLGAEIGDTVAIGSPIVRLKVAGEGNAKPQGGEVEAVAAEPPAKLPTPKPEAAAPTAKTSPKASVAEVKPAPVISKSSGQTSVSGAPRPEGEKPLASPAVRLRAKEAGIDLRQVAGSGPAGRIGHEDIEAFLSRGPQVAKASGLARNDAIQDIKVVGLRRKIAEKMSLSKSRIPHITYVEEIDVTALEDLRASLNK